MKKIICLMLALLLLLPTLPAFADGEASVPSPSVENATQKVGINFNDYTNDATLPTGISFTANSTDTAENTISVYNRADGDNAVKICVKDKGPYIQVSDFNYADDSIYTIDYDIMFDGDDEASYKTYGYSSIEVRTINSHQYGYPLVDGTAQGSVTTFIYGKMLDDDTHPYTYDTWYSVRIVFDGPNDKAAIYVKTADEADYTLIKAYDDFAMDGLKMFRINARKYSTSAEANIYVDNIYIYEEKVGGTGDSGAGDSGTGDSGTGDSGTGDSGTGDTGTGDSGTGDTGTGDSGTGDSGTGDSGTGETPTDSALSVENAKCLDITKPLTGTLSVKSGFESADIYIDDKKIAAVSNDGSTEYQFSADILDMTYLGEAVVKAVIKYSDETETVSENVYLTKLKNPTGAVFSEDFSSYNGTNDSMKLVFNADGKGTASNAADKLDSSNNVAKISLTGDGSFMNKSSLGYSKGAIFTLDFDVMFGGDDSNTSNSYLRLELRDYNTKHEYGYPYNDGALMGVVPVFGSDRKIYGKPYYANRWYSVRLVADSITKGVDIYYKEKASDGDYELAKSYPEFVMEGFKEFRFTVGKLSDVTKGEVYLDNVNFYENRNTSEWYVKSSVVGSGGALTDKIPVNSGGVKLMFSKDMGSLSNDSIIFTNASGDRIPFVGSYDSSSFVYTITPSVNLNYSSEYNVALASGLKADDLSNALSSVSVDVTTEKYPVKIKSFSSTASDITVTLDDASADGEMLAVARYKGSKLCDVNFVAVSVGKGTYNVALNATDSALKTVIYILDSDMNVKDVYSEGTGTAGAKTLMSPSSGHPRVYLNNDYIAYLKANKDNGVYASNFKYLLSLANLDLPVLTEDTTLSESTSNRLVARALMYALGEVSEEHAERTVEYTIDYIKNAKTSKTDSISKYKDFGTNAIQTGALVLDWCYNMMSDEQKTELAGNIKDLMANHSSGSDPKYQPCRPDNVDSWSDIAGKAVGQPLVYNSIAAVAIYDEHPEIYNTIMPKIQGSMADIVRLYGSAGALSDGSIAYTREYYSYYVALLFERMGYDNFYGDQTRVGYKLLYSRLPYGAFVKQGDDFSQRNYKIGEYTNRSETKYDLAMLSVMYNDPYLRYQYVKENPNTHGWEALLLTSSTLEPKLPDTLPLAYYVDEPRSEILARTSWQDGLDSPAAVGLMSIHNRRSGDHDHSHIGDFQLYYKGPLTMPGGQYEGENGKYGEPHHLNYYQRTISANCVTVEMPNEIFKRASGYVEANDGGQRAVTSKSGGLVVADYDEHMADDNIWASTEAHYIGPNEKTPAFSYIKGDITKAYSTDKMESYRRSMVFMDTFNEEYPAAMIVFDRVVSTNESYKKKWLLQSVTEPTVEDNKITIVNTEDGANGKLVNTTLLPESVDIQKVGEVGKYIVDGKEYPTRTDSSNAYKGGIRLEVSPTEVSKEDIFLNAMYVTDADGNAAELPMIKEENNLFVGMTALDRMVMFSKSAQRVNEEFELDVRSNGYAKTLCLITDIESGSWCVEGGGERKVISSESGENLLVFSVKAGKYRIYPVDEAPTTEAYDEAKKEKIGDYSIKLDKTYTYVKNPNKLVKSVPFFAVADFAERYLDADAAQAGSVLTITASDGAVLKITDGSNICAYEKGSVKKNIEMSAEAFSDNGVMYAPSADIADALGLKATWYSQAKVMNFLYN